jgi:hypothetical protein
MLLDEGAHRCRCAGNAVKRFDELMPKYLSQEHKGKILDDGDEDGIQCLRSEREVGDELERRKVLGVLRGVIERFDQQIPDGWSEEKTASASFLEYRRADTGRKEVIHSRSYKKESSAFHVMCICLTMK